MGFHGLYFTTWPNWAKVTKHVQMTYITIESDFLSVPTNYSSFYGPSKFTLGNDVQPTVRYIINANWIYVKHLC